MAGQGRAPDRLIVVGGLLFRVQPKQWTKFLGAMSGIGGSRALTDEAMATLSLMGKEMGVVTDITGWKAGDFADQILPSEEGDAT